MKISSITAERHRQTAVFLFACQLTDSYRTYFSSHLCPRYRITIKRIRQIQSMNMASQMPNTPSPSVFAKKIPVTIRKTHMEPTAISITYVVSPAAFRVWGKVKASGQSSTPIPP